MSPLRHFLGPVLALSLVGLPASADEPAAPPTAPPMAPPMAPEGQEPEEVDAIAWHVSADSYARLFQRAAVPGPSGSLVQADFAAPFYQYALLQVRDIDLPWAKDSVDVELSAWGNVEMATAGTGGRRLDGDITVARVTHRIGPGYVGFGRQIYAGGAARFVRFDGLRAGIAAPFGLGLDAYGGFTVLPRWSARPGYYALGNAADTLLDDPSTLESPSRSQYWLAGARGYYRFHERFEVGASFHEQREDGGLGRRNLGGDLRLALVDEVTLRSRAVMDLDATDLTELRVALDMAPRKDVDVGLGFFHAVPALFLSRQSVLSVFSTSAYDEIGADLGYRPIRALALGVEGWAQRFTAGDLGARLGGQARLRPDLPTKPILVLAYRRILEPINGYHSLRAAVSAHPIPPLLLSTEVFTYLYDAPIQGVSTSFVGIQSVRYAFVDWLAATLSGSAAQTPYAEHDLQALARIEIDVEGGSR